MIQDIIYRHFVYDKYHWNPLISGNVEKLHRDYAIGNYYVVQKYSLKNEVTIPADFDEEPINQICSFDLDSLIQNMNSYFIPIEDDDIFFFTKEMTDEYIAEAVEYCARELDNLECQKEGTDGYLSAWDNMPRSILESTMNTRELGMYRIQGTKHYPIVEGMLPPNSLEDVPVSYMEIAHANCMREVFTTIANTKSGVLFHCTAGKDRTGVISAILLALAGVSDEDIVYDYAISREFNKLRLEAFLKEHPEIDREIVLANEKSMHSFLEMLRGKHNSVEKYLSDIGITGSEIQRLKNRLVKEG